jgi:8-oxo-dGTP pyrophosphatase MutT (NUDIX family)
MENSHLIWKEQSRKARFKNRIFTIQDLVCVSPGGEEGTFSVMDCQDWAIVIPVLYTPAGKEFIMVRQWRHGSQALSLEFPGGVCEPGEAPEAAAMRELSEETAYTPGCLLKLGEMNPNPAIMTNRVHFFMAKDLRDTGKRNLDTDEYVDVEIVPADTVIRTMGKPPYVHSLMAAALMLYLRIGTETEKTIRRA